MPSSRKRIGYLPSREVHEIIEKICSEKKFSQSKLTGLLVEEALIYRGYLNKSEKNSCFMTSYDQKKFSKQSNSLLNIDLNNTNVNTTELKKGNQYSDLNMINEFIEYKLFKKIMIQNQGILE